MLPKVIVIVGPTSTKKTSLAIKLANKINGEIISADAFQVYKELNVGVNKPTSKQLKLAKFHLINYISINESWDIAIFQKTANKIIDQIINHKKIPIICGGSNLYIDALIKNYDLSCFKQRSNNYDHLSNENLYNHIFKIDANIAQKIGINNRKRLLRAYEILNEKNSLTKRNSPLYKPLYILCEHNTRQELYEKINTKVLEMINNGWKDEVKDLIEKNQNINQLNAFKAIGYEQIFQAIKHNQPVDIAKIQKDTRRYAKRQLTWIRHHYQTALVFNQKNEKEIINQVKKWIK